MSILALRPVMSGPKRHLADRYHPTEIRPARLEPGVFRARHSAACLQRHQKRHGWCCCEATALQDDIDPKSHLILRCLAKAGPRRMLKQNAARSAPRIAKAAPHDLPHPAADLGNRPTTSIWTDFTNAYNGETLIGSYPAGAFMADWTLRPKRVHRTLTRWRRLWAPPAARHSTLRTVARRHSARTCSPERNRTCGRCAGGSGGDLHRNIGAQSAKAKPWGPCCARSLAETHQAYVFLQKNLILSTALWISQSTRTRSSTYRFQRAIANFYQIRFQEHRRCSQG